MKKIRQYKPCRQYQIIFIEDDPSLQEIIKASLERVNGEELLTELRKNINVKSVPAIILSGNIGMNDDKLGIIGGLSKALRPKELVEKIDMIMRNRKGGDK